MKLNIEKENLNKTGVYKITNLINGKFYIGSTSNSFYNRYHQHLSDYKAGKTSIKVLYRAIDKYGIENFEFTIVHICNKDECINFEQLYIDQGTDYNCCPIAGSMLGYKHPDDSKTKTIIGGLHHSSKIVYQFNKTGEFIKKFESIIDALKELGKDKNGTSHITQACIGEVYSAFGFRWSFTEELIKRDNRLGKCKIMIEKDGIEMQFKSQIDAAAYITSLGFKCNQSRISNSFKRGDKVYGFKISKVNE